jgi:hypothetical protein
MSDIFVVHARSNLASRRVAEAVAQALAGEGAAVKTRESQAGHEPGDGAGREPATALRPVLKRDDPYWFRLAG